MKSGNDEREFMEHINLVGKPPQDLFLEQNGFIYMYGDITHDSTFEFTKSLHRCTITGSDPIHIFINSSGGVAEDAISLYDQIKLVSKSSKVKIVTIGCGDISSGATILLQAGDYRIMTSNSIFMVHEPSYGVEGPSSQHKDTLVGADLIAKIWLSILSRRCKDKKKVKDLFTRKESYLTAKQCLTLGLIDEIT